MTPQVLPLETWLSFVELDSRDLSARVIASSNEDIELGEQLELWEIEQMHLFPLLAGYICSCPSIILGCCSIYLLEALDMLCVSLILCFFSFIR
jgi:hypothetical protein